MAYAGKTVENPVVGQTLKFVQTTAETKGELLELEAIYQSGSTEPLPHYHPKQDEWFTVKKGILTVRTNGEQYTLRADEYIHLPANQVHSMWNDSTETTVVQWIIKPALQTEAFFENAYGLAQDGKVNAKGMPSFWQVVLFAHAFSDEFRLAKPPYLLQKIIFGLLVPIARWLGYRAKYQQYIE